MNIRTLKKAGIDYTKGVERVGSPKFYAQLLLMFLQDPSMQAAHQAIDQKDYPALFDTIHMLKGTCGNLDLFRCYQITCQLVELLRPGEPYPEAEIRSLFGQLEICYAEAVQGIRDAFCHPSKREKVID